jgi:hypothetical protein
VPLSPPSEQLLIWRREVPEVEQAEDLVVVARTDTAVDEPSSAFVTATGGDGWQVEPWRLGIK